MQFESWISQNLSSVHVSGLTGANFEGSFYLRNFLEMQSSITAYHKKWLGEINYSLMPYTRFGAKNKIIVGFGRSTNLDKRFNFHFLFGIGYFFSSKNNTGENTEIRYFYPSQVMPGIKLGFVYNLNKKQNICLVANAYINYESIKIQAHGIDGSSLPYPGAVLGIRYKLL
jgi:hypothetical protein